jgi:hypothetical protein
MGLSDATATVHQDELWLPLLQEPMQLVDLALTIDKEVGVSDHTRGSGHWLQYGSGGILV